MLRLELRTYPQPLGAFSAKGYFAARKTCLLSVYDGSLLIGIGEASPLPDYSPDTFQAVLRQLGEFLATFRGSRLSNLIEELGRLAPIPRANLLDRCLGHFPLPAARFAVETALRSAVAARLGEKAWSNSISPEKKTLSFDSWIKDSAQLYAAEPDPSLTTLVKAPPAGKIQTYKVKLSPSLAQARLQLADWREFRKERERQKTETFLRVDLNGGGSEYHNSFIEQLLSENPQFVEEPHPHLAKVLSQADVPLAFDESLPLRFRCGAAALKGAKIWIIKATIWGGEDPIASLYRSAEKRGIQTILTHCFEGATAFQRGAEIAYRWQTAPLAPGYAPYPACKFRPFSHSSNSLLKPRKSLSF